eukprot:6178636-Pleurochrysis_carterae.AAC.2
MLLNVHILGIDLGTARHEIYNKIIVQTNEQSKEVRIVYHSQGKTRPPRFNPNRQPAVSAPRTTKKNCNAGRAHMASFTQKHKSTATEQQCAEMPLTTRASRCADVRGSTRSEV